MSRKSSKKRTRKGKIEKAKEKESRRRKKVMAALLVLMSTSLEIFFERKRLFEGEDYFGCKVIKKSSSNIYKFFFPLGLTEI